MKKIKLSLILFLFLFILFPCMVKAATFLEASTQRPVVGSDIYVLLTARYGNLDIREMYLRIKYDPSYFSYEESYWIQGTGTVTNKNGYLYIKKPNNGRIWTAGLYSAANPVFIPSEIALLLAVIFSGARSALFSRKLLGLASGDRAYMRGMTAREYAVKFALMLPIVVAAAVYEGVMAVNI